MNLNFRYPVLIAAILLLAANAPCRADSRLRSAWSAPVNGLRGRLMLVGKYPVRFFLELQNVSALQGPLKLDFDPAATLKLETIAENGSRRPIEIACFSADGATSGSVDLSLPGSGLARLLLICPEDQSLPSTDPFHIASVVQGMFGGGSSHAPPVRYVFACTLHIGDAAAGGSESRWTGELALSPFELTPDLMSAQPSVRFTSETLNREMADKADNSLIVARDRMDLGGFYDAIGEKQRAIEVYRQAIADFGDENYIQYLGESTRFWGPGGIRYAAQSRIANLENELGHRDAALNIFDELAATTNTRVAQDARNHGLLIRQDNLPLTAKLTLPKSEVPNGEPILAEASIRNDNAEKVVFRARVRDMLGSSFKDPSAWLRGGKEITLGPGEELRETVNLDAINGPIKPGECLFACWIDGAPDPSDPGQRSLALHVEKTDGKRILRDLWSPD